VPLASRNSRRYSIDIWPGFVDALSQLLMVIIFILLVFTAAQFYLSDALTGRDEALKQLQQQVAQLADLLALERHANQDLRLGAAQLSAQLKNSLAERDTLTTRVTELAAKANEAVAEADAATGKLQDAEQTVAADKDKIELQLRELASLQEDIATLKTVREQLEAKVSALAAAQQQDQAAAGALRDRAKELEAKLASEQEKTVLAQKELDKRDIRLKDLANNYGEAQKALAAEKGISAQALAEVAALNQQVAALRDQLSRIAAALDLSAAKVKSQQAQIVDLGKRLNMALVNKVEELARYRSEFFGKLRQIIGNRPDIRIVGDRFVFQSEVLFPQGSADLTDAAKQQLIPVFAALRQIAAKIPPDIDWILRVDGHTDRRPINNALFKSNWELSTARAIAVVHFAIDQGISPKRLAATGFADYQPIDPANTEEAYRRNRRIELKLTEP
jgi:chemotaxis protein MotB